MSRSYYSSSINAFLKASDTHILGRLSEMNEFELDLNQRNAWMAEIHILKEVLEEYQGDIIFEYSIPRIGHRIDTVVILNGIIFVLEFKIGATNFAQAAIDQVWDYALDLKSFHDKSHHAWIAPVLICTEAKKQVEEYIYNHVDGVFSPIKSNLKSLPNVLKAILELEQLDHVNIENWEQGKYSPTPTIIQAAIALYNKHSVAEISRTDASAINLSTTTKAIEEIIATSKRNNRKAICFVTGVPGAGKTLVGLNIATSNSSHDASNSSVFLSGNGPLVKVLQEALTRDKVKNDQLKGKKTTKGEAGREVKTFIQNVHHFRDHCLVDESPPFDHIAVFDEAQRAWDAPQTAAFMAQKKNVADFDKSESEFLISCLDRHEDWAVIVCLVGGGQEINKGEGGIAEWLRSLHRSFNHWDVYVSNEITDSEYSVPDIKKLIPKQTLITFKIELHLGVSLRSYRAEHLSAFIKHLLDLDIEKATRTYNIIKETYPIVITRSIEKGKGWLRAQARGSERFGLIVSSQAQRLKPYAIDIKTPVDPVHWFLDGKDDVRSSYYLEDVATEFQVQGLELDWAGIVWDGDFRHGQGTWDSFSFIGNRWNRILKSERKSYLKNAYRVLMTRARQGLVIMVPEGDIADSTRNPIFYSGTWKYLNELGLPVI